MTAERVPAGLEEAGRSLWAATLATRPDGARLVLRADELVLLVEACRLADDLDQLRTELVGAPLVVSGSKDQPVANPLRAELHRTISSLDRVLRTLALPDEVGAAGGSAQAGRALARVRWG